MKLAPEQTQAVKSWIAAGASIADVQKRLNDEFKVSLTYMDTRFLILDELHALAESKRGSLAMVAAER